MKDVYDQHQAAFDAVSAFVILKDDQLIGRVSFKFPRDGAGRLTCFAHILGIEMKKGFATGYGYDKRSAAFLDAMERYFPKKDMNQDPRCADQIATAMEIVNAMRFDGGQDWTRVVERCGFQVIQAI